jgi:leucyl/phenylalanyl-tRNA--protein transferase
MRYQAALRPDIQYSNRSPTAYFLPDRFFPPNQRRILHFMTSKVPDLPWLMPGTPFPQAANAWPAHSDAPGLLAAGGDLRPETLRRAYAHGIFPWFSQGQPILWWSPEPRMTLNVAHFRLHRSLRKTLTHFQSSGQCEIRFDTAFAQVIQACASAARQGPPGTWIVPAMVSAYNQLHLEGYAHSVETWINGELAGGLYCVTLGHAVFGESMFTKVPNASKIALAALVAFCREHGIAMIDCQQNTAHLKSLGATEIPRQDFLEHVVLAQQKSAPIWRFDPLYWQHLLST